MAWATEHHIVFCAHIRCVCWSWWAPLFVFYLTSNKYVACYSCWLKYGHWTHSPSDHTLTHKHNTHTQTTLANAQNTQTRTSIVTVNIFRSHLQPNTITLLSPKILQNMFYLISPRPALLRTDTQARTLTLELTETVTQSWALSVFFNFFNNKKWFFCIFVKLTTYFCTSPI